MPTHADESGSPESRRLLAEARKLSPAERVQLVELLLADLHQPDAEIDRLWAEEAQRRWEGYLAGEVETLSLDEVMGKYRR